MAADPDEHDPIMEELRPSALVTSGGPADAVEAPVEDSPFDFFVFFSDLLTSESKEERLAALESISATLREQSETGRKLLAAHVKSCFRLSRTCPFSEVRDAVRKLLDSVASAEEASVLLHLAYSGPSKFVPSRQVPQFEQPKDGSEEDTERWKQAMQIWEDVRSIGVVVCAHSRCQLFMSTGRVSHIEQLMGWHPAFLQAYAIRHSRALISAVARADSPRLRTLLCEMMDRCPCPGAITWPSLYFA